jgi:hypothetical protein
MRSQIVARSVAFAAVAGAAMAQVQGPFLGLIADGSSLRAMFGIASAGTIGGALNAGRSFSKLVTAPNHSYALGVDAATGEVLIVSANVAAGSANASAVTGAGNAPDQVVLSPSGTSAALWFAGSLRMQIVSGLPGAPSVRSVDVSYAGSSPSLLAVSDDGQWAAGAWGPGVYSFDPNGSPMLLPFNGPADAICFFHGNHQLAVHSANQVALLSGLESALQANVIWSKAPDPPGQSPGSEEVAVGLAASFDNRYLTVAGNRGDLYTFDLAAGQAGASNCACAPSGLTGIEGSLYRLTGLQNGSVKVFDAAAGQAWFVPLASVEGDQQ